MSWLWEGVKSAGGILGQAAKETGLKGKLQTELLLCSREIDSRKRKFGEELYDYVEPLSKSPDFFSANDRMTDTLRGPLLTAQREISALDMRRGKVLEKVAQNDQAQKGAFVTATNVAETLQNTAKRAGFASTHAKLSTDLSALEVQIRDYKQVFGLEMYQIFVDLEDGAGWLPTVRDIRSIYDQTRRDVEKIEAKRREKEKELMKLGGTPMTTSSESSQMRGDANDDDGETPKYFKEAAAADGESGAAAAYSVPTPPTLAVPDYGAASQPPARQQQSYNSSSNYGATSQPPRPAAQQQQQSFPDPFLATSNASSSLSQPVDPFSSMGAGAAAHTSAPDNNNDFFGAPTATTTTTTATNSSFGSMGMGGGGGSVDPFAMGGAPMGGPSESSSHDPFAAPMGTGNFMSSATAATAAPSDDPFAAFDNIAPPQTQQQQQQQPNQQPGNPMFRY